MELILKGNNTSIKENCGICGNPMTAPIPLSAFIEGTNKAVCDKCLEIHAPELLKAQMAYYDKVFSRFTDTNRVSVPEMSSEIYECNKIKNIK